MAEVALMSVVLAGRKNHGHVLGSGDVHLQLIFKEWRLDAQLMNSYRAVNVLKNMNWLGRDVGDDRIANHVVILRIRLVRSIRIHAGGHIYADNVAFKIIDDLHG